MIYYTRYSSLSSEKLQSLVAYSFSSTSKSSLMRSRKRSSLSTPLIIQSNCKTTPSSEKRWSVYYCSALIMVLSLRRLDRLHNKSLIYKYVTFNILYNMLIWCVRFNLPHRSNRFQAFIKMGWGQTTPFSSLRHCVPQKSPSKSLAIFWVTKPGKRIEKLSTQMSSRMQNIGVLFCSFRHLY